MALSTSNQDAIQLRREAVASLRLRGLSQREITVALASQNPPIVNPTTGEPYSSITIKNDLDALKAEWRANASVDTAEHMARQLAELWNIKRAAWGAKDPELALKALDREMKLTGTVTSGLTVNINIALIERLVTVAKELAIDPNEALNQFVDALLSERTSSSTDSG